MATTTPGRPRSFDREAALDKATRLFWERGYEATSVADLTAAMGIKAPSMYAAFGDKKTLFAEVVRNYQRQCDFIQRALEEEPTVRAGIERVLAEAAAEYTQPDRPRGCLVITSAINCASAEVEKALRDQRNANVRDLEHRINAAKDLPANTEGRASAVFVGAVLQGMSQQARDGASREELELVAETAIRAWPVTRGRARGPVPTVPAVSR